VSVKAARPDFSSRSAGFKGDDMVDPKGWLESEALSDALLTCQDMLLKQYKELDRLAKIDQSKHFSRAVWAAIFALVAIVVALVNVGYRATSPISAGTPTYVLAVLELLAGGAALVTVAYGIWTAYHHEWLLNRYRAERLRYAKFHFLTSADLWVPSRRDRAIAELRDEARDIRHHGMDDVKMWLKVDRAPRPADLPRDVDLAASAESIRELRAYYHDTRLAAQLDYLAAKAEARSHRAELVGRLPQMLFFATAGLILLHFAFEAPHVLGWLLAIGSHAAVREEAPSLAGWLTVALVLLAVALPASGAMFRTIFAAREMGRNATRSSAKLKALEEMSASIREEDEPSEILRHLWLCEYVIESDHREWLRLMIDAEWFG